MKQTYSISHLTLLKLTPPQLIYVADQAGYDFVSLRTICMNLGNEPDYSLADNAVLYKETKEAFENTTIQFLDVELAKIYEGMDLVKYEREMEIAATLGAKHVISSIWTEDKTFAIEQYERLCEIASQYNMSVDLEAVPISSVKTIAGIRHILEQTNASNKGLLVDIHHFHRSREPISELHSIPDEWVHFIHLCDAQLSIPTSEEEMRRILREERLYIGEGGIDIHSIVNALPNVPMSIETPNLERSNKMKPEQFALNCLQSAKAYFNNKYREIG
ncbi:MAG: sugar phosphate isomerase/epimerase [Solibacillus sp.]|uniref:sugar phosphate isomerase/epimerase family protein n=1 Tax=unclassified Solibacillus TaxID=2637870 RepID=UPI0030FB8DA2